jgi:type III secretion protein T
MASGFEKFAALLDHFADVMHLAALVSLCSARATAMLMILPATSSQRLTGMVRVGLPLWIGIYIAWGQPYSVIDELSVAGLAARVLVESMIGLLIGFAAATIFWTAEGVGSMIDNLAGYNNVQQSNPQSTDQSTPVGHFLLELSVFAFYALGGMLALLALLFDSFAWWPLAQPFPAAAAQLLERFTQFQVSNYMMAVARIAAPALLVLMLIDLAFGLLTKTAEKLEPNGMAQPVKGAVAMVLLSLIISVFFNQVRDQLSLRDVSTALKVFFGVQ